MVSRQRERIHLRVRKRVKGTRTRPRLSVFRSLKHIYASLIDDENRKTLLSVHEGEIKGAKKLSKKEKAKMLGELIAKKAIKKKIKRAVFDRGGYKYHGRVKALAEGARKGGLKF